MMKPEEHVNVLVVGGGAAGLAAAATIEEAGLSCQVIEAQSHLGGRVQTCAVPGRGVFDRGAQMVNGDMQAVLELVRQQNMHCAPLPKTGRSLYLFDDHVYPADEFLPPDKIYDLLEEQILRWDSPKEILRSLLLRFQWWTTHWESVGEAGRGLKHLIATHPATAGSLGSAIRQMLLCPEEEALAYSMLTEAFGAAPEMLNAHATREIISRYASRRDDMEFHFPEGMGGIIDALVSTLERPPLLSNPVLKVVEAEDVMNVHSAQKSWEADHVLIAVPPPAARQILFEIKGQDDLFELLGAFEAGDMIKTALDYETAFWRLKGLSGTAIFADPTGLVVTDASADDSSDPRLIAFLGGPEARLWAKLSEPERQQRLLDQLSRAFGPAVQNPKAISDAVWVDHRWSGGGYNATIRINRNAQAMDRLADWPGRVSFAGAELDTTFWGYVEGAILSGRSAAKAIVDQRICKYQ